MSGSEEAQASKTNTDPKDESLKFALALSLLRSKLHQSQPPPPSNLSDSDALRWKRKAKERKQEIFRLREDLKEAEDASQCDLFPQSASCKCYFFDNLGKLSPKRLEVEDGSDRRFNDVLRRRFFRQVRFKERRRRTNGSIQRRQFSDLNADDEIEQLRASVDFLVELCDTVSNVEKSSFTNWAHQAVDFILASLKNLLSTGKNMELIEGIVSSLIMRLVRRMCSPLKLDESLHTDSDAQFYVQHLIRKLGSEAYIGQRTILSVSQRISVQAESLLFLDPFDEAFPNMHECMFTLIQLIEFLISDYLLMWSRDEGFDQMLFEEWLASVLHARKALELLENRNGLYVLYIDRVTGELSKQVSQSSSLQKLKPEILDNLFQ
ncbi:protein MULTIPOLAR SPINDLE 1 [Quercus lobata]|uniref:Multipolar spindle 1 n=1 Tax=Quercus lobata TaxID=97700 RepID=A0A7N2L0V9_QUELO|nr:protein MULTIPOLAR SPINDLE 1 [Quercus lobata]